MNDVVLDKKRQVEEKLYVLGDGAIELRETATGLGVFALIDFKKGEPITEYYGKFISHSDATKLAKEKKDTHCRRHIVMRSAIDGKYMRQKDALGKDTVEITDPKTQLVGHGIGAFCNDSSNDGAINAAFEYADSLYNEKEFEKFSKCLPYNPLDSERCTFIYAKVDISAGSQVCASYGEQYWQRAGIKKN